METGTGRRLARLLLACADAGASLGTSADEECPHGALWKFCEPFLYVLGHPAPAQASEQKVWLSRASVARQLSILERERRLAGERSLELIRVLQGYATVSPACIELVSLFDSLIEDLRHSEAKDEEAGRCGVEEGASIASAKAKHEEIQRRDNFWEKSLFEATMRTAQIVALLTSAILTDIRLDSICATASTRRRLAGAVCTPSRLGCIGALLLSQQRNRSAGSHTRRLLQLCICRMLAACASLEASAAWRLAVAVNGAEGEGGTAFSATGAPSPSDFAASSKTRHSLARALAAMCEGPTRGSSAAASAVASRAKEKTPARGGASPSAALKTLFAQPSLCQTSLCECADCTSRAASREEGQSAAGVAAAAAQSQGARLGQMDTSWFVPWGPSVVRCCCLACSQATEEGIAGGKDTSATPGTDGEAEGKEPPSESVEKGQGRSREALHDSRLGGAEAETGLLSLARERVHKRQAQTGVGGCGVIPVQYAIRQMTLRLCLVLIQHSDCVVPLAFLKLPKRHAAQDKREGLAGEATSSAGGRNATDGRHVLLSALNALRFDRPLDCLTFLSALQESARLFETRPGLSRALLRRFVSSRSFCHAVPGLIQSLTGREAIRHLLKPLCKAGTCMESSHKPGSVFVRCGKGEPCCLEGTPSAMEKRKGGEVQAEEGAARLAFFSASWILVGILAALFKADLRGAHPWLSTPQGCESPLLSLCLNLRTSLPPQQELLASILQNHFWLYPQFMKRCSSLLLNPRQSYNFALSCLWACRLFTLFQGPLSSDDRPAETTADASAETSRAQVLLECKEINLYLGLTVDDEDGCTRRSSVKGISDCEESGGLLFCGQEEQQLQSTKERAALFEQLEQRNNALDACTAAAVPPQLALRQHLTHCLLHQDPSVVLCGVAVLRSVCARLLQIHKSLERRPVLQKKWVARVKLRLPEEKTLVNCVMKILHHCQGNATTSKGRRDGESWKADGGCRFQGVTPRHVKAAWPSDADLFGAADKQKKAVHSACESQSDTGILESPSIAEGSDVEDDVEVYVEGLDTFNRKAALAMECNACEESPQVTVVPLPELLRPLLRQAGIVGCDHFEIFQSPALMLGWLDVAAAYQRVLAPHFPLDFLKLLCSGTPSDAVFSSARPCCRWLEVGARVVDLAVQARGGAASWGAAVKNGEPLNKSQQALLMHMLVQWYRGYRHKGKTDKNSRDSNAFAPTACGTQVTNGGVSCVVVDYQLENILRFLSTTGLFADGGIDSGLAESSVWISALCDSTCFRCCSAYFVSILKLASERHLSRFSLPLSLHKNVGNSPRLHQAPTAEETGVSPFLTTILRHLAANPHSNNGRPVHVDIPSLGLNCTTGSCWSHSCEGGAHAGRFCAEATSTWAAQSLMRIASLRPQLARLVVDLMAVEGPWRVLGERAALGEVKPLEAHALQHPIGNGTSAAKRNSIAGRINKTREELLSFLQCLVDMQENPDAGSNRYSQVVFRVLEHLPECKQLKVASRTPSSELLVCVLKTFAVHLASSQRPPGPTLASTALANAVGLFRALLADLHRCEISHESVDLMSVPKVLTTIRFMQIACGEIAEGIAMHQASNYGDDSRRAVGVLVLDLAAAKPMLNLLLRARHKLYEIEVCHERERKDSNEAMQTADETNLHRQIWDIATVCLDIATILLNCIPDLNSLTYEAHPRWRTQLKQLLFQVCSLFAAIMHQEACEQSVDIHNGPLYAVDIAENGSSHSGSGVCPHYTKVYGENGTCTTAFVSHIVNRIVNAHLLLGRGSRRLFLRVCDAVLISSGDVLKGELTHLSWLLPLIERLIDLDGQKHQLGTATRRQCTKFETWLAKDKLALLRVLLKAFSIVPNFEVDISGSFINSVMRFQEIPVGVSQQLFSIFERIVPFGSVMVPTTLMASGTKFDADIVSNIATGMMVALCFKIYTSSRTVANFESSEKQRVFIAFRKEMIPALRARWKQCCRFRTLCTRVVGSYSSRGDTRTSDSFVAMEAQLHPATNLALLLEWCGDIHSLPGAFSMGLTQLCENEIRPGVSDGAAGGSNSKQRGTRLVANARPSVGWVLAVVEALQRSSRLCDRSHADDEWLDAALFLPSAASENIAVEEATSVCGRWADAVSRFLQGLCIWQPRESLNAHLALHLALALEAQTKTLDDEFLVSAGIPVATWVRQLVGALHPLAVACTRCDNVWKPLFWTGRSCIASLLKDLKTTSTELFDGLCSVQGAAYDDEEFGGSGHGAAAAAADLLLLHSSIKRAVSLSQMLLELVRYGLHSDVRLPKEDRQFLKSLRPKVCTAIQDLQNVVLNHPPTSMIRIGVDAALLKETLIGRSERQTQRHIWQLFVWVSLIVPLAHVSLDASFTGYGSSSILCSTKHTSESFLKSPALNELAFVAKSAARCLLNYSGSGISQSETTVEIYAALTPLVDLLFKRILPSCFAGEDATSLGCRESKERDYSEKPDQPAVETPAYRHTVFSRLCPDLFEALCVCFCASGGKLDSLIGELIIQDSHRKSGHVDGWEENQSADLDRLYNIFDQRVLWMTHLPDFSELAPVDEAGGSVDSRFCVVSSCDWLALHPLRVQRTLDNFPFHARTQQQASYESVCRCENYQHMHELFRNYNQMESWMYSALRGTELNSDVGDPDGRSGLKQLCQRMCESASGKCSVGYDAAYIVPYLAGRLTAACFLILRRWQQQLQEEQAFQQQLRNRKSENGTFTSDDISALRARPVCVPEQARRACGVAGAWLRSLEKNASAESEDSQGRRGVNAEADEPPVERVVGIQPGDSNCSAVDPSEELKRRRREDVWEMEEFDPELVKPAVIRMSAFLRAARSLGRMCLTGDNIDEEEDSNDARRVSDIDIWGAALDEDDQWLSRFATSGGLQLLLMALGCQDVATRSAALHGLSVFTHLLQLSVDKTMLLHFAEVHEFNTRRLKRMKTSQKPGSRMRDITLRHKNANFSFKAIRQLIVLLSSVRSSVERTVKTSDVNAALSPLVCAFAAASIPVLFTPENVLYPILNVLLLRHPSLSVLLHDPYVPLTLSASRQPLLGSSGLLSRLVIAPAVATAEEQISFLATVLRRAMAASRGLADGSICLNSRIQGKLPNQGVLPSLSAVCISLFPTFGKPNTKGGLPHVLMETLLVSTATPRTLASCGMWSTHDAFRIVEEQLLTNMRQPLSCAGSSKASQEVVLPICVVNAQMLLQRYGILQWIKCFIDCLFQTHVGYSMEEVLGSGNVTRCKSVPSPYPDKECLWSDSLKSNPKGITFNSSFDRLNFGVKQEQLDGNFYAASFLVPLQNATRLLWSVLSAAMLAVPFPTAPDALHGVCSSGRVCANARSYRHGAENQELIKFYAAADASTEMKDSHGKRDVMGDTRGGYTAVKGDMWPVSDESDCLPLCHVLHKVRLSLLGLQYKSVSEVLSITAGPKCEDYELSEGGLPEQKYVKLESVIPHLLRVLETIQRVTRSWFTVGCALDIFSHQPPCTRTNRKHPNLWKPNAAIFASAASSCFGSLWVVASFCRSVGLCHGVPAAESVLQKELRLQIASCCSDILNLCAWQTVSHCGGLYTQMDLGDVQEGSQNPQDDPFVWKRVIEALSSEVPEIKKGGSSLRNWRMQQLLVMLYKIRDVSGNCEPLDNLLAASSPLLS